MYHSSFSRKSEKVKEESERVRRAWGPSFYNDDQVEEKRKSKKTGGKRHGHADKGEDDNPGAEAKDSMPKSPSNNEEEEDKNDPDKPHDNEDMDEEENITRGDENDNKDELDEEEAESDSDDESNGSCDDIDDDCEEGEFDIDSLPKDVYSSRPERHWGGLDHAASERHAKLNAGKFAKVLQERLQNQYLDSIAKEGECIGPKQGDRCAKVVSHLITEKDKTGRTRYGCVIAIYDSLSPEAKNRVKRDVNQSTFATTNSTGKLRMVRHSGPAGTNFTLGSENEVHVCQQSTVVEEEVKSWSRVLFKIQQEVYEEENKKCGNAEKKIGYVHTDYPVMQCLAGPPDGVAYAKHRDTYRFNTASNLVRRQYSEASSGSEEIQCEATGDSQFLPTVAETQVCTFTLGDNLVETDEDGNDMYDDDGIPLGLSSIKWLDSDGATVASVTCGNDLIHFQCYFVQSYFEHQVDTLRLRANAELAFRYVASLRASMSFLNRDHFPLLVHSLKAGGSKAAIILPSKKTQYLNIVSSFVDPTKKKTEITLPREEPLLVRAVRAAQKMGIRVPVPSPSFVGGKQFKETKIETCQKSREDFEKMYNSKMFGLERDTAIEMLLNKDVVSTLCRDANVEVLLGPYRINLARGPTVIRGGEVVPVQVGELVKEADYRTCYGIKENLNRSCTWSSQINELCGVFLKEPYKNDEYVLQVAKALKEQSKEVNKAGHCLKEKFGFKFCDTSRFHGSGGSASYCGAVAAADWSKVAKDSALGKMSSGQILRLKQNAIGADDEESVGLNLCLFEAVRRRSILHVFSSIGCRKGLAVFLGVFYATEFNYKAQEGDVNKMIGDWVNKYGKQLIPDNSRPNFSYRNQPHVMLEMARLYLPEPSHVLPRNIWVNPKPNEWWWHKRLRTSFTGKGAGKSLHCGHEKEVSLNDWIQQWIQNEGYKDFMGYPMPASLQENKIREKISVDDFLNILPHLHVAVMLRFNGVNVIKGTNPNKVKIKPLIGETEIGDIMLTEELMQMLGFTLRSTGCPSVLPSLDVVCIHLINHARYLMVDFMKDICKGNIHVIRPYEHLETNYDQRVNLIADTTFGAIVNRMLGKTPVFREYFFYSGDLLPTLDTTDIFLEYVQWKSNPRGKRKQGLLSDFMSQQHPKTVACEARKYSDSLCQFVQNLKCLITSARDTALKQDHLEYGLSPFFASFAKAVSLSDEPREDFITVLMDVILESCPAGKAPPKLEFLCSKVACDLDSVFDRPMGKATKIVYGYSAGVALDQYLDMQEPSSATSTGKRKRTDNDAEGTQLPVQEKAEILLEKMKQFVKDNRNWGKLAGYLVDEKDVLREEVTRREASVDHIDQSGCKIGGQRGFTTASRTQSDKRKVYSKHEWPQFGCEDCYKFTHGPLMEYSKEVISLFLTQGLEKLSPFFRDLRERYL